MLYIESWFLLHADTGGSWSPWSKLFARVLTLRRGLTIAFIDTTKILMFFGGGYILWLTRSQLPRIAFVYGLCSLALARQYFLSTAFLMLLCPYRLPWVYCCQGIRVGDMQLWGFLL